jgi:hypothetical protein
MTRRRRSVYEVIVARYAHEPVTAAEGRRLEQYRREQARLLRALVPDAEWAASPAETKARWKAQSIGEEGEAYRRDVQEKLDTMTAAELRTEVQGLLFLLMMADDIRAELEGKYRREHQQHSGAGGGSGKARRQSIARIHARIEGMKAKNAALTTAAAARNCLREADDKAWNTLTDAEQQTKIDNLIRRLSRLKKNTGR